MVSVVCGLGQAASLSSTPHKIVSMPDGFPIRNHVVFQDGDIFLTAKANSGELPTLFRLGAGDTDWRNVIDMPDISSVPKIRADGTIFSFEPADASLNELTD